MCLSLEFISSDNYELIDFPHLITFELVVFFQTAFLLNFSYSIGVQLVVSLNKKKDMKE